MLLKNALLIGMILSFSANMAMEYGDSIIFDEIRKNTDFASLDADAQECYAEEVNMNSHWGCGPLTYAILARKPISMLKWLITHRADVNPDLNTCAGKQPLLSFVVDLYHGSAEVIELLLDHHADLTLTDDNGDTPLQFAKKKLEKCKGRPEPVARIEPIINMLETAERQKRAWDTKKTWIAGVNSHC